MRMIQRIARRQRAAVPVRLYERPGCHLCDDAERLLYRLADRYPVQLQKIDITSDSDLVRRYDIRIPVLVIDDSVELEAPIDGNELERVLKSAQRTS